MPFIGSTRIYGGADVGQRSDGHTDDSIYGVLNELKEHVHSAQMCYPTLDAAVTITGHANAWTLGAAAEIVPASTITSDFDIHFVNISNVSANGVYELHLFYGASATFAGCVSFTKTAGLDPVLAFPLVTPLIPANSQVTAKLANAAGGSEAVDIKIAYHTY